MVYWNAVFSSMLPHPPSILNSLPRTSYGSDHSAQLLGSIAEAGSGTYYYIESEENIPTAFADALGGLLSVASQVGFPLYLGEFIFCS
jgi:hypothetical protein